LKNTIQLDRRQWVAIFFFLCFGWITYQAILLARPFLPGVLGASILGIVFFPLYQWVIHRVHKPNVAAAILTAGIFFLTVIPLVGLGLVASTEADNLSTKLDGFMNNYETPSYIQHLSAPIDHFFAGFGLELKPLILDLAKKVGDRMNVEGPLLGGHIIAIIFNGIVLMSLLFFVFRNGKNGAQNFVEAIPMSTRNKQVVLECVYGTFRGVIVGIFVTAVTEGLADMAGFFIAGAPLAILLGFAVAIFSLLGASVLITIPVSFWVMNHDTGMGIFLLIWGILVSVLSDNVLKAALIGSQARLPFLLMLFSTLGGIKLYGVMGLFLGPLTITAFMTFWDIYRKDYEV
jgi:predicted PurR-regulated permease PerM